MGKKKIERTVLDVTKTINAVIQGEIRELIEFEKAAYIKFQLIVTSIEFLGACLDKLPFEDNKQSEKRFNKALKNLFPKQYHKYAKASASPNLYQGLRCGMLHKFKPSGPILLTERRHLKNNENLHMTEVDGILYLVLEDFYDDLFKACEDLKN